jgi:hypothetical protein
MRKWLALSAMTVVSAAAFAGCGLTDSGPRKIVINEGVCSEISFLRMNYGEETRIVVDNSNYSDNQDGLSLEMVQFPGLITGDYPEGAQTGPNFVTFRVSAERDEQSDVTVRPTIIGEYKGRCNVSVFDPNNTGGGGTVIQKELTFQIVD